MSTASDDSVPDGTTPDTGAPPDATASDGQPAARQEYEIEVIRDHLGDLVNELGVRRDEWRPSHILRRLPIPFLLLGLCAVGLGAGVGIWQWRVHVRQRDSWLSRAHRLSLATHRAIKASDDVAKTSPSVAKKIATAVAATASGMVIRRFLSRYLGQFTHVYAEHRGSRSGRLGTHPTARTPNGLKAGQFPDLSPQRTQRTQRRTGRGRCSGPDPEPISLRTLCPSCPLWFSLSRPRLFAAPGISRKNQTVRCSRSSERA